MLLLKTPRYFANQKESRRESNAVKLRGLTPWALGIQNKTSVTSSETRQEFRRPPFRKSWRLPLSAQIGHLLFERSFGGLSVKLTRLTLTSLHRLTPKMHTPKSPMFRRAGLWFMLWGFMLWRFMLWGNFAVRQFSSLELPHVSMPNVVESCHAVPDCGEPTRWGRRPRPIRRECRIGRGAGSWPVVTRRIRDADASGQRFAVGTRGQ